MGTLFKTKLTILDKLNNIDNCNPRVKRHAILVYDVMVRAKTVEKE
jgi:hypothetical protein